MSEKKPSLNLRHVISDALATSAGVEEIRRLVPIAWPVSEVEQGLRIRVEEELGVVERFLIEAVARFGPMTSQEISELLGIDVLVIEKVVHALQRFPGTLSSGEEGFIVSSASLERLGDHHWSHEIEERELFLVNGVDGNLLPIALGKAPPWHWLSIDVSTGMICDQSGRCLDDFCWIANVDCKGNASLEDSIRQGGPEERLENGVPEGTFERIPDSERILRRRWMLALMEVEADGSVSVRPAASPDTILFEVDSEGRQILENLVRRGEKSARGILQTDLVKRIEQTIASDWKNFIGYEASDGTLSVTLFEPASLPLWPGGSAGARTDVANAATNGGAKGFPPVLRDVLSLTYWWHPWDFAVRRIVPANAATAERLLLLRGMQELANLADQYSEEEPDLDLWWKEFQKEVSRQWGDQWTDVSVSFSAMLREARRAPETAVVELVSEYV